MQQTSISSCFGCRSSRCVNSGMVVLSRKATPPPRVANLRERSRRTTLKEDLGWRRLSGYALVSHVSVTARTSISAWSTKSVMRSSLLGQLLALIVANRKFEAGFAGKIGVWVHDEGTNVGAFGLRGPIG